MNCFTDLLKLRFCKEGFINITDNLVDTNLLHLLNANRNYIRMIVN